MCGWNRHSKISLVSVDEPSTNLEACCDVYGHKREGKFSSLHLWMVLMEGLCDLYGSCSMDDEGALAAPTRSDLGAASCCSTTSLILTVTA